MLDWQTCGSFDIPKDVGYQEGQRNNHVDIQKVEHSLYAVIIFQEEIQPCESINRLGLTSTSTIDINEKSERDQDVVMSTSLRYLNL